MRLEGFEPPSNGLEGRRSSAELQAPAERVARTTGARHLLAPRKLPSCVYLRGAGGRGSGAAIYRRSHPCPANSRRRFSISTGRSSTRISPRPRLVSRLSRARHHASPVAAAPPCRNGRRQVRGGSGGERRRGANRREAAKPLRDAARPRRLSSSTLSFNLRGGRSSIGRAPGCGPGGCGFESHRSPLSSSVLTFGNPLADSLTRAP